MELDSDIDRQLLGLDWTAVHFWGRYILKHIDECVLYVEELIYEHEIEEEYTDDFNPNDYFE